MTATIDQSALDKLLSQDRIGILDGGLATYLEDGLNFDLSKGPLWSARLLDEKEDDVSNGKGRGQQPGLEICGWLGYPVNITIVPLCDE